MVGLDEAHATHICCQVENMLTASDDLFAVVIDAQVNQVELIAEHCLLQKFRGFCSLVNQSNPLFSDRTAVEAKGGRHIPAYAHFASNHSQLCSAPRISTALLDEML